MSTAKSDPQPVRNETGISDAPAADAALIDYFRILQFRGREWDQFIGGLYIYDIARTSALLASGAIFAKARLMHDEVKAMAAAATCGTVDTGLELRRLSELRPANWGRR